MGVAYGWIIVSLAAILAWLATTWIRARYGYPLDDGMGSRAQMPSSKPDVEELRAALQAQDATIVKLEERVRVLERIVTEDATRLGDEIERLRA